MPHNTDIRVVIGRNIRRRRLAAGLSQKAAGICLGVSFQQVQKYERGINNIPPDGLVKLAALFECSIADFFESRPGQCEHTPMSSSSSRRTRRLLINFNRIRSGTLRESVCTLVQALVDEHDTTTNPRSWSDRLRRTARR